MGRHIEPSRVGIGLQKMYMNTINDVSLRTVLTDEASEILTTEMEKMLKLAEELKYYENDRKEADSENILPCDIACPNCGIELELEEKERIDKRFTCPECKMYFDLNSQSEINIIKQADDTLFQSNNPNYERELSNSLMQSPLNTINAIVCRGWILSGTASSANFFLVSVLDRIYRETKGVTKEKALDVIVDIFETPDDNSYEWLEIIKLSTNLLVDYHIPQAKSKLEAKKKHATGKNLKAIEYALSLMK